MKSLTEVLQSLPGSRTLDVGCGCGKYARSVSSLCERLVCLDISAALRPRWRPAGGTNLDFCCMDARILGFRSSAFSVVFERESLHHMAAWERALNEMFRVSARYVALEEPVDDPRSPAKRLTMDAQELFLELQQEIGISHYRHLDPEAVLGEVTRRGRILSSEIVKRDDPVSPAEFFSGFSRLAEQSARPRSWESRLEAFLKRLGNEALCRDDSLVVLAEVRDGR